jgi:membrane-bound lytic murein transglycosylase MltF
LNFSHSGLRERSTPDRSSLRQKADRDAEWFLPLRQQPPQLMNGPTRRSPLLVALIVATLPWCLTCQVPNRSPSANGTSQEPAPAAKDASVAHRDDSPIGGQALSDEFIARMLAPWHGDLPGIKERRYLRMLVTFNRTHYFADRMQQHGVTYDAGELFETFLNQRLNMTTVQIHVVFIPVTRDRLFQALADGKGDIAAAGLTVTPEREARVAFAPPFVTNVREIVVTSASQAPVATADDLSGRPVHVRKSSSYYQSLTELNHRLAAQGKAPVEIVAVPEALETEDLLEMANADLIPITIADDYLAEFWAMVFDGMRLQPAAVNAGRQLAWAVRKDAPELQRVVDAFVRANPKGSTSFNTIFQRYLKNADYVKNATSEREMAKFRQIRGLFEKYGDQYDLPWPLLAAQAYQESQLNQTKTSSAGAVGVMQIKPSTAAGSPINITGGGDQRRQEHPSRREVSALHRGRVL